MSTETAPKPYLLASREGLDDVWWKSGRVTIKAGPGETGNAFSQLVVDEPRGSGTPLHVHHNEDETFYILEGQARCSVTSGSTSRRATTASSRAASPTP